MTELLISYRQPAFLSESELRSWFAEQVRVLCATSVTLVLVLAPERESSPAEDRARLLRVGLPVGSAEAGRGSAAELVAGVRLLGLRPEVVTLPETPSVIGG